MSKKIIKVTNIENKESHFIIEGNLVQDGKVTKEKLKCQFLEDYHIRENDLVIFESVKIPIGDSKVDTIELVSSEPESRPEIEILDDNTSIIKFFMKHLNYDYVKAKLVYRKLLKFSPKDFSNFMDEISEKYTFKKIDDVIIYFENILTKKEAHHLLICWYRERLLRKILILGLREEDVKDSFYDVKEFYNIFLENPFKLTCIDINKCFDYCRRFEIEYDNTDFICGSILREMKECMNYTKSTFIRKIFFNKYHFMNDNIRKRLIEKYDVVEIDDFYQFKKIYEMEHTVAKYLADIQQGPKEEIDAIFLDDDLNDDQKAAVQGSLNSNVSMISGGAGTGKTKIIKTIVDNLNLRKENYALCSFVGKAVSVANKVLKKEIGSTLDRLICKKDVKTIKVLIVDESSMLSTELFYRFIKKFKNIKKIIFVGDINQLPPINIGALFYEMLESKTIEIFYLKKNYRSTTGILKNSENILNHKFGRFHFSLYDENEQCYEDFFCYNGDFDTVKNLLEDLKDMGIDYKNINVICPYVEENKQLNTIFQQIFVEKKNKPYKKDYHGRKWFLGDLVHAKVNSYEKEIFNGTKGEVTHIDDKYICVTFDNEKQIKFSLLRFFNEEMYESIDIIEHNYSITVDKSQGDQNKYIIFFVPPSRKKQFVFNDRYRIYTAITRAQECIYIIGDMDLIEKGINTDPYKKRKEKLSYYLKSYLPVLIKDEEKISSVTQDDLILKSMGISDDFDFDFF